VTSFDRFGLPLGAVAPASVEHYDAALRNALLFQGDPLADLDRALAADPGLGMAYVLHALIAGLSTERPQVAAALERLATARRRSSDDSERFRRHLAAAEAWARGEFAAACLGWEEILIDHPADAVAMYAAHQADFFLGQSRELRDRVERRLARLAPDSPVAGHYRGMQAFGLEEMGDYDGALAVGARAVQAEPGDAWAIHAVAHVHEMTGRIDAGEHWLDSHASAWVGSNLAVHLWWHRALYLCAQQQWSRVLEVYDAHIRRPASDAVMELLDATSLLWRLALHGVDVGDRWHALADAWAPRIDAAWYAFNDLHAMMAFAGARRFDLAARLLETLTVTAERATDNGSVTRRVGVPVARALLAYSEQRYAETVRLLDAVRPHLIHAGGSHAQRDVFVQTLEVAAARRAAASRFRILPADLADARIVALLEHHATTARAATARGSAHALDLVGLHSPEIRVWTIWVEDVLYGVGALKRLTADHGEVKSMHTVAALRGKGAGGAMLEHLIAQARSSGMTRLSLETGSWDYFTAARALYRRHGFVDCDPFADYVLDPNSVFLTRML